MRLCSGLVDDIVIDLDESVQPVVAARRRWPSRLAGLLSRGLVPRLPLTRAAVLLGLALLAAAPQAAPARRRYARAMPVPSYCTGAPMPGGRLNILDGDRYIILDGPTKIIISTGRCRRR